LNSPAPKSRRTRATLAAAIVAIAAFAFPLVAHAATYDPLNVIPYETWRGASSLSAADIQAFLSTQSGPLKSLVTTDYVDPQTGGALAPGAVSKSAAQIVFEAARRWNLNPKVIIATLQKEQSLISVSNSSNAKRLRKAMGCGVYDVDHDGKIENLYPGFGNQIWNGARVLSTYEIKYSWYLGKKKTVKVSATGESTTIVPANASTFALYTYTPYYPQISVWRIYLGYFGDPQTPPRMRPVYRFRNRHNGTYYYTASEAKRYTLIRTAASKWAFEGVSFTCDTSATANTAPLYQMYNTLKHTYYYTTSDAKRASLLAIRPKQWRFDKVTCYVTRVATETAPVYKLEKKSTGGKLLTSSASLKKRLTSGRSAPFIYRGIAFYLGASAETTPPVGPSAP